MKLMTRMPPPTRHRLPHAGDRRVEQWTVDGFEIVAATDRGLVRLDNQDAYAVAPGRPRRIAVFDGVGGLPNGGEAARAAAARLPTCGHDVLGDLEAAVRPTGGVTTATIAEISGGMAQITWVGDSCAYRLTDKVELVGKPHRLVDGRLTQAVGFGGIGDRATVSLDAPLLLCTDGVPRSAIQKIEGDLVQWVNQLMDNIHRLGAPDNLTLVVIRRQQVP